jgi:1-acyl-sn-glycerol-3-phosphate acyltransferase
MDNISMIQEVSKNEIDKSSFFYWLLQQYAKFAMRLYFKKIESQNRQNIERGKPVIIASNHQNALMDALLLVYDTGFQPVFLTRADIFKGNLVLRILRFLKMMPIYRVRDGVENLKRNEEIFDQSLQILQNSYNPLCIFPEGNHNERRKLRPLSKGVFRIAFSAQQSYGKPDGAKIVPVGVDYSDYRKLHQAVTIIYGKPINIAEFYPAFLIDSAEATQQLKDRLFGAMKELMIDIQHDEYYDLYMNLRTIYNPALYAKMGIDNKTGLNRFKADKNLIRMLDLHYDQSPADLNELDIKTKTYISLLNKHNLRDWVVRKNDIHLPVLAAETLMLVLLLPVFIPGFVINILPYYIPVAFTRKNVKDLQMHSSFKFVISMVLFPVWYLILFLPVSFLAHSFWQVIALLLSFPLSGYLSFHIYLRMKKYWGKIRFLMMKHFRKTNYQDIMRLRTEIINSLNQIIGKYNIQYESRG